MSNMIRICDVWLIFELKNYFDCVCCVDFGMFIDF